MQPRRRRTTYHHGDLPEALLAAAEALVAKNGPAGFSLREAARVVGVDPAACYRHFRDRDDVLRALARKGFTRLVTRVREALGAPGTMPPEDEMLALGNLYVDFAVEESAAFRTMFGATGLDTRNNAALRGDYAEEDSTYIRLQGALRRWSEQTGRALDVDQATLLMWSSVHGLASLLIDGALQLPDADARHELVRAQIRVLLAGFSALAAPKNTRPRR